MGIDISNFAKAQVDPTQATWGAAQRPWPQLTLGNSITVGTNPHGVAITPAGDRVLVCNSQTGSVTVISTATQAVIRTITGIAAARSVAITPDGNTALVSQYQASGNLYAINLNTYAVTGPISCGGFPNAIAIRPQGDIAYVANSGAGFGILPVTISNLSVGTGIATSQLFTDVCFTPDGTKAYATSSVLSPAGSIGVTPITVAGGTPGSLINTGATLVQGIICSKDGSTIYALGYQPGYLIPITVSNNTMQPWLALPGAPSYLTLSPDGKTIWVASYSRASLLPVSIALLNGMSAGGPPPIGPEVFSGDPTKLTLRPVVSPDGSTLYCTTGLLGTSNTLLTFAITPITSYAKEAAQADVIGTDGLIGGPGSVGLSRWVTTLAASQGPFTDGLEHTVLVSQPIPANFMTPGTHFRVRMRGHAQAGASGNLAATIRMGPLGTIADPVLCTVPAAGSFTASQGFYVDGEVTCQAVNSNGQVVGHIFVMSGNLAFRASNADSVTINCQLTQYLTLTVTATGTTPSVTPTNAIIELAAF